MEQSLWAEGHVRSWLHGLPDFGVARLQWNDGLLADGVLSITALTALLRDGTLVDVPRNANVAQLTLAMTGGARVPVYLHLLEATETGAGNPVYTDDPPLVGRVLRRLQLSSSEKMEKSVSSLKLADFEKLAAGKWVLSQQYIPPLLEIAGTPFLLPQLAQLKEQLTELEPKLVAQLQDTFLRLERIASTRVTLARIYQIFSLLADFQNGVGRHPYQLFEILRAFYFDLCSFHELLPEQSTVAYAHTDLGASFGRLFTLLAPRLRLGSVHHSHVKFAGNGRMFVVNALPDVVKSAQQVYLLIQKQNIHDRVIIDDVKVAATSRLALIHRMVLMGIPHKLVERVHFQHAFGPEVDFYELTLNDEWAMAAREGSLAFYQTAALEKAQAFLFWR
jgi:type VI secretion system protein ImpJ